MKRHLRAVAASDLEEFLAKLDLLDDVKAGKLNCAVCGQPVSLANLGCVYPEGEMIRVSCDALPCYSAAARHRDAAGG
ncbi:MAG: hypothetical protein IMF16_09435 [Proteobacteria bacterium]|nr:hypothetical protein [Pseudomonadota bacterium]